MEVSYGHAILYFQDPLPLGPTWREQNEKSEAIAKAQLIAHSLRQNLVVVQLCSSCGRLRCWKPLEAWEKARTPLSVFSNK
jgi:3-methyladenine DNA glycosylase AlkC